MIIDFESLEIYTMEEEISIAYTRNHLSISSTVTAATNNPWMSSHRTRCCSTTPWNGFCRPRTHSDDVMLSGRRKAKNITKNAALLK